MMSTAVQRGLGEPVRPIGLHQEDKQIGFASWRSLLEQLLNFQETQAGRVDLGTSSRPRA